MEEREGVTAGSCPLSHLPNNGAGFPRGPPIGDPGRSVNPGLKGHDLSMWTGPEMSGAEGGRGPWGPRIPLMLHSPVCNPSAPLLSFKTKKGRQVCADPSEDWVQEYITDLELNP